MARARRSRRRGGSRSRRRGNKLPLWVKVGVITVLSGITLLIVGYVAVRNYIASDDFRNELATNAGLDLGGEGRMSSLSWTGWDAEADDFVLSNGRGSVKAVQLEGLKANLKIGSIVDDAWDLSGLEAMSLDLTLGPREKGYTPREKQELTGVSAWLPEKADFKAFELKQVNLHYANKEEKYDLLGVRVKGEKHGEDRYQAMLFDGEIQLPWDVLPSAKLLDAKLVYKDNLLEISNGFFKVFDNNKLGFDASLDFDQRLYQAKGKLQDTDVRRFIPKDWLQSLKGSVTVIFDYLLDKPKNYTRTKGHINLKNGVVQALPLLDKVASYTGVSGYRRLELKHCSCHYLYTPEAIVLSNINIQSAGKVRVEGKFTIYNDDQIKGDLMLGIPASTVSFIPGAETMVFKPGKGGMVWTPLKLTGTLDDLNEDLSDRMIAAAANRMLNLIPNTGNQLLNGESPIGKDGELSNLPKQALNTGANLLSTILGDPTRPLASNDLWRFKGHGAEVELAKKWKKSNTWREGVAVPFAKIIENKKVLARAYVAKHSQPARQALKTWKDSASGELSRTKEFLTTAGHAALLVTSSSPKKRGSYGLGECETVVMVQFSNDVCIEYRYKGAHRDLKILEQSLEAVAMSIKPAVESIIPELPKIDGGIIPIPNPFGF